jgi:hypothetical protein
MGTATRITACRACGGALDRTFCDLGDTAVANSYLSPDADPGAEPRHRLCAVVCRDCRLVQLDVTVDAAEVFGDYAYFSSMSSSWVAHAAAFCAESTSRLQLGPQSWVVEAASNDGYLLRHFVERGVDCLGIEPAANVAQVARAAGVPTLAEFLTPDLARSLVARKGRAADLVVANNVIAHVPDIVGFVRSLAILAGDRGVVSIECPHLLRLIDGNQFDTLYHEHYFYWSLHALERLLAGVGLGVFHVERLPSHGGSLRVHAAVSRPRLASVDEVRREESERGVAGDGLYRGFQLRAREAIDGFRGWLDRCAASGMRVAAYGAAAKGNTLLNAAGAGPADLLAVADRAEAKQGRLLPGSHVPIVSPEALLALEPDAVVILPWNIREEVAAWLRDAGFAGETWTAVPEMRRWS